MEIAGYQTDGYYDELFAAPGRPRPGAALLLQRISALEPGDLTRRQQAAEAALMNLGITFAVYSDAAGTEKVWPFDIVPRIVEAEDWRRIEAGLEQRIRALNAFLADIYGPRRIIDAGLIPEDLIASASTYRAACQGLTPPRDVWCHITGTDLVRDGDGMWYVLEDNLRCPSGVSYVLENRQLLKRTFPRVFADLGVKPVDDYPNRLLDMLQSLAPSTVASPTVVVLSPGIYNSAYFEHAFLAQQMGVELVEGRDLTVADGFVMMRTTRGFVRVDVIYRRVDDDFLDPAAFRPDSMLGVRGLMDVYRNGRVALANAPGTGVADDKVIYSFVPQMIEYYLGEAPILPNVPTYLCWIEKDRQHVLANLENLVVKAANESGGYGMLIGTASTRQEREAFAEKISAQPRNYIAQPVLSLSRAPVLMGEHLEGRHVDLRPFVLYNGEEVYVLPGGLTRVALRKGSLVVNSSQGGGSKDTWVLQDHTPTPEATHAHLSL